MKSLFCEGLLENDIDKLLAVPKSDIHNHSTKGCRRVWLEERLQRSFSKPPEKFDGLRGMQEWFTTTIKPYCMDSEGLFIRWEGAFAEAGRNNIKRLAMNFGASEIEFIGGIVTNSVSIISDAVHDFGDAISIGVAYFLEKISKKKPDNMYTYGYIRYSVIGAVVTNVILMVGSIFVILSGINRFIKPVDVNYDGMIIFALFGVCVNFFAAYFTRGGRTLNQRAVNLHMLEDVLGWVVVLIGAFLIKFTKFLLIDAILSIGVALFIFVNAVKGLKRSLDLFLEKIPEGINIEEISRHLLNIKGVKGVHHIHIWSIDGVNNYATMHIVCDDKMSNVVKSRVKKELRIS